MPSGEEPYGHAQPARVARTASSRSRRRRARARRPDPDPAANAEAVGAREHEIEHDQIWPLALDECLRGFAVGGLQSAESFAVEVFGDDLAHDRLVVDHEHGGHADIVREEGRSAAYETMNFAERPPSSELDHRAD